MALQIIIKVNPSSGRSACQIDKNGTLKCSLKSPPENGKANEELIALISKKVGIPKNDITLLLGKTSRTKTVQLKTTQTVDEVRLLLCDEMQLKIK
jgi:uncharacterized protein (TIGR00251 family)